MTCAAQIAPVVPERLLQLLTTSSLIVVFAASVSHLLLCILQGTLKRLHCMQLLRLLLLYILLQTQRLQCMLLLGLLLCSLLSTCACSTKTCCQIRTPGGSRESMTCAAGFQNCCYIQSGARTAQAGGTQHLLNSRSWVAVLTRLHVACKWPSSLSSCKLAARRLSANCRYDQLAGRHMWRNMSYICAQ